MLPARDPFFPNPAMPSRKTLARANARIADWASRRAHVIVVPLTERLEELRAGAAIQVGPWAWTAGDSQRFMQPDGTHPTEDGLLMLARLVVEGLRERFRFLPAEHFVADLEAVRSAMLEISAAHESPRHGPRVRPPPPVPPARR